MKIHVFVKDLFASLEAKGGEEFGKNEGVSGRNKMMLRESPCMLLLALAQFSLFRV